MAAPTPAVTRFPTPRTPTWTVFTKASPSEAAPLIQRSDVVTDSGGSPDPVPVPPARVIAAPAAPPLPVVAESSGERARSGVPGLDALLEGGFPAGRCVLVCGRPGTGKTTLATQFLVHGAGSDEPGVLISVDQKPRQILHDTGRFRWGLELAIEKRVLALLDAAPYFTAGRDPKKRLDARQLASELARQVRELKARRLAIDGIASLVPDGLSPAQARDFLRSVIFAIEDNLDCTTLLTSAHDADTTGELERIVEELASGVVELKLVRGEAGFERRLFVRKMRGTAVPLLERRFEIVDGRGVVVD